MCLRWPVILEVDERGGVLGLGELDVPDVPAEVLAVSLAVAVAGVVVLAVAAVAVVAVVADLPCSSSSCGVLVLRIAPFYALFHLRFARASGSESYVRAAFWGSNIHAPSYLHALQPNTSTSALPRPLPCPPSQAVADLHVTLSQLSLHARIPRFILVQATS